MELYQQAEAVLEKSELIYSAKDIERILDALADKINHHFSNASQPVLVLPIMNGGLIVSGHLITRLKFPIEIDYLHATRYRNETTGGELQWRVKPQSILQNRTLLIIDDIFDEGHTIKNVVDYCVTQNAVKTYSAVLFEKNHPRDKVDYQCNFVGATVEDRYVFGFGMDYKGYHRHLNAVYAVND